MCFLRFTKVDERLRNRIEILTEKLDEANIKIKELYNAKSMIDTKMMEEVLCKVPFKTNSSCKNLNIPKVKYLNKKY